MHYRCIIMQYFMIPGRQMSGGHLLSTDRSGVKMWECIARNNP